MNPLARSIQRTYLVLLLGNTLAASFIWGINTLFLLDAGLSNLEAFAATAFFTAGMVVFEVPTGVVADTWGRRTSYLLGTVTLAASTLLYFFLWQFEAPFWQWAVVSMLLGLGFTFFSGATEAWLVDALSFAEYQGDLEAVFGRGQMVSGVAMLGGSGVGFYAFYAMQPFLLELWGDSEAYSIAGLAAAIVAGSQIAGGYLAPHIRGLFERRTSALILGTLVSTLALALLGFTDLFWLALGLLVVWGLIFAAELPIRQAYLNGMIPSQQRATVLSFDSLMGSTGGVVVQPVLGKSADVYSYANSYLIGAAIQVVAVPFLALSRREKSPSDA